MFSAAAISAVPISAAGGAIYVTEVQESAAGQSSESVSAALTALASTVGWGRNAWNRQAWQRTSTGPLCSDTIIGKSPINTAAQEAATASSVETAGSNFLVFAADSAAGAANAQALTVVLCATAASATISDLALAAASFAASASAAAATGETIRAGVVAPTFAAETAQISADDSASFVYFVNTSEAAQIVDLVGGVLVLIASTDAAALIGASAAATTTAPVHVSEFGRAQATVGTNALFITAFADGAQITDVAVLRALWELIDDSQTVTWQNVASNGGAVWSAVSTPQNGTWQLVQTSPTTWSTVDTAQPSVWVVVST